MSNPKWPDDYDAETVAMSGGTGRPAIEYARRNARHVCPECGAGMVTHSTIDGAFVCLECEPLRDELMRELEEARANAARLGFQYDRRAAARYAVRMLGKSSPIVRILCLEILSEQ